MKNKNNCNCKTMLTAPDCFFSMAAWLLLAAIGFMTAAIAYEPFPGQYVAAFFRMLWVISISALIVWRISIQQRLVIFYLPKRNILTRFGMVILMVFLPPILEIPFLIKVREPQEVYSFWLEFRELDAVKLSNAIKEGDYFAAKTDSKDDPSIVIVTPIGEALLLIRTTEPSLYLCMHLEDNELPSTIKLSVDSDWRIEAATDGSAHAAVFEVGYCPEAFDETELAEILTDALNELISYFKEV